MLQQRAETAHRLADAEKEMLEAQNGSGDSEGLMAVEAIDTYKALQTELARLDRALAAAVVVTSSADVVEVGATVVLDFGDGDNEEYCFGTLAEGGDGVAVLTPESPIGQAIAGRSPGDLVDVATPKGCYQIRIVSVA